MNRMTAIRANKVFTGYGVLDDQLITCSNGQINSVSPYNGQQADHQCNCIAPGFFDIHINGGEKYYFSKTSDIEGLRDIEEANLAEGTVYTLPTLITSPVDNILKGIKAVRQYKQLYPSTGMVGMHLEGPFINPIKRGAHPAEFIRQPTNELLDQILHAGRDVLVMITVAPEQFSEDQFDKLIRSGINVSIGHSNATYEQAEAAFAKGCRLATHLFNAMSSFMHRAPGLAGAALNNANVYTPVILDGDHCHFASAAIAYKIKKEKFLLISDALFVGRKVKDFVWGDYDAHIVDGKYINSEGNLTGAVISLADAVRNAVEKLQIPLAEAVEMATRRPALALGLDDKMGSIAAGYPSKFTVFNEGLEKFESLLC